MKCGAKVYTVKDNYELGDNIQSKVMAFAFGLSAEIERELISQRTKEALARLKLSGKKLGRQFGSKNKTHKLDGKEQIIRRWLASGKTKREIARLLHVSVPTIYNHFAAA